MSWREIHYDESGDGIRKVIRMLTLIETASKEA